MSEEVPFYPHPASNPEVVTPNHEEGDDFELSQEEMDRLLFGVDNTRPRDVIALKKINEAASEPAKKEETLSELTKEEIFILEQLKEGSSLAEIAAILQKETGEQVQVRELEKKYREMIKRLRRRLRLEEGLSSEDFGKRREDALRREKIY